MGRAAPWLWMKALLEWEIRNEKLEMLVRRIIMRKHRKHKSRFLCNKTYDITIHVTLQLPMHSLVTEGGAFANAGIIFSLGRSKCSRVLHLQMAWPVKGQWVISRSLFLCFEQEEPPWDGRDLKGAHSFVLLRMLESISHPHCSTITWGGQELLGMHGDSFLEISEN